MTEKLFEIGDKRYCVKSPTAKQIAEAKIVYNKAFKNALENGAYLRAGMEKIMFEQGIWSEEQQKKLTKHQFTVAKLERKLCSKVSLTEAKKIAVELRETRNEVRELSYLRSAQDDKTAEGQAEAKRMLFYTVACTYDYLSQKPVFASTDEYEERADEEIAQKAIEQVSSLLFRYDVDFETKLVENKFFARFGEPEVVIDEDLKKELEEISAINIVSEDVNLIEYADEVGEEIDNAETVEPTAELVN